MGLLEQAQFDIKRITSSQSGFTKSVTFISKDNLQTATIFTLFSKVHLWSDTDGNAVNTKKGHISFAESLLTDLGYTTRNATGQCILKDHTVKVNDSTGKQTQHVIKEVFPDETIGLIVCLLSEYEA